MKLAITIVVIAAILLTGSILFMVNQEKNSTWVEKPCEYNKDVISTTEQCMHKVEHNNKYTPLAALIAACAFFVFLLVASYIGEYYFGIKGGKKQ